ncbi:hypothetical protein HZH68_014871 [Vespula germanica]|uniref:Uncharacterized protein n=1 Tax=Vespula germanica TaxID=30212 RepID=A0A834J9E6_VESGE|nr:hypothetical protein HZH68_014871 [Vespula germanica]
MEAQSEGTVIKKRGRSSDSYKVINPVYGIEVSSFFRNVNNDSTCVTINSNTIRINVKWFSSFRLRENSVCYS